MNGLLAILLLMGNTYQVGTQVGSGLVAETPVLLLNPWAGARSKDFTVSFQAPLRLELNSGEFRARDRDELGDLGRIVRIVRFREQLHVGLLKGVSLGRGSLVRRYDNTIDDDHRRLGMRGQYTHQDFRVRGFVDQLLGLPVAGLRLRWKAHDRFHVGLSGAGDMEQPRALTGAIDATGRLVSSAVPFMGYGLDLVYRHPFSPRLHGRVHADVNGLGEDGFGAHLGLGAIAALPGAWSVEGFVEGMYLGPGYTWSFFDTGYLLDRWRGPQDQNSQLGSSGQVSGGFAHQLGQYEEAFGGRLQVIARKKKMLSVGGEYADSTQSGRSDLMLWLTIPTVEYKVNAFWRNRSVRDRWQLLDPREVLAGGRVEVKIDNWGRMGVTAARVWRVFEETEPSTVDADESSGPVIHRYEPNTELLITFEVLRDL